MYKLIKRIRTRFNMNQEEFAKVLGTSSITVNRWENRKVHPNRMAEKQLYQLCKDHCVDMSDEIVAEIRSYADGQDYVLYHGSREGIQGEIRPISRWRCDFGKGFYMGTDPLQPLTLICNEERPVCYVLSIDLDDLKYLEVDVSLDWAMLIAYFRGYLDDVKGSKLYDQYAHMADGYDVIIGCIADDRMYQVLTDFFEGRITDTALLESLSALDLGKQYVAVTDKACDHIHVLHEKKLSSLELMILKDRSIVRRKEGISLAERITKEHRRDGLFFDEILNKVDHDG